MTRNEENMKLQRDVHVYIRECILIRPNNLLEIRFRPKFSPSRIIRRLKRASVRDQSPSSSNRDTSVVLIKSITR